VTEKDIHISLDVYKGVLIFGSGRWPSEVEETAITYCHSRYQRKLPPPTINHNEPYTSYKLSRTIEISKNLMECTKLLMDIGSNCPLSWCI